MGSITYTITSGDLPITVNLLDNDIIIDTNDHYIYESGNFVDIPISNYKLQFIDSYGCIEESDDIGWCEDCYEGYTPISGTVCIKYLEKEPSYTATVYTIDRKTEDTSYGVFGTILFDSFNYNGTGVYTKFDAINEYWINNYTTRGPMNRCCVWGSVVTDNQDVGFSICIDIAQAKTYYLGFGCDNYGNVKLNGNFIIEQDMSALSTMFTTNGDPDGGEYPERITFRYWYIYPINLIAGNNVIEVFGHNVSSVAAIGIELYNATYYDLYNAQSDSDLGSTIRVDDSTKGKILFRSSDLVGEALQYEYSTLGGYHGYYCENGWALNSCGETPTCIFRDEVGCGDVPTTTSTTTLTPTTTTTTTIFICPTNYNLRDDGYSSAQIDAFLNCWADDNIQYQIIDIRGNDPRTSASDDAIVILSDNENEIWEDEITTTTTTTL